MNMGYCRFENTLGDLRDCKRAMNNGDANDDALSAIELKAKQKLIRLCIEIAKEYGPQDVSNALYAVAEGGAK